MAVEHIDALCCCTKLVKKGYLENINFKFWNITESSKLSVGTRGSCFDKCPLNLVCSQNAFVTKISGDKITVEPLSWSEDLSRTFGKYDAKVKFLENVDLLNETMWMVALLPELIQNCCSNKENGNENKGAKNVIVKITPDWLTVEDDYEYKHPEKILKKINAILRSGRRQTTRKPDPNTHRRLGGAGIYTTGLKLAAVSGKLEY